MDRSLHDAGRCPTAEPTLGLRATARIHEIDRRLRTISFARMFGKWVAMPIFALTALLIGYLLVTRQVTLTPGMLLPVLLSLVALSVFWSSSRTLQSEEEQLHVECAGLVAGEPVKSTFRVNHPERRSPSA